MSIKQRKQDAEKKVLRALLEIAAEDETATPEKVTFFVTNVLAAREEIARLFRMLEST